MSARSATSSSGRSSSSTANNSASLRMQNPGDVPAAVRQLLTSTKELQATLLKWGIGKATETDVSNIFVRVGTEYNYMSDAFFYHGINIDHINSFTKDLRTALQECLSEDPTPSVVDQHMPEVRRIFYTLLKGLQARQTAWQSVSGRVPFMSSDERF